MFCSPLLGEIYLAVDGDGALSGLWLAGQSHFPDADRLGARADEVGGAAVEQLAEYLAGTRRRFELRLAPRGTAFQQRVWQLLRQIPYGGTSSYGALAERLGSSARAVGAAVGRNPISIIIPCHRVVGRSGSLTGYAGGLERKELLLRLESDALRAS